MFRYNKSICKNDSILRNATLFHMWVFTTHILDITSGKWYHPTQTANITIKPITSSYV